ncbi:MAG: hypothetical protein WCP55_04340 [Lentisphaerota bacterium]
MLAALAFAPLGTPSPSSAVWKFNTMRQAGDWRAQGRGTRNELRYYERRRKKRTHRQDACATAKRGGTPKTHRQDACATAKTGGTPKTHRQDACATFLGSLINAAINAILFAVMLQ